MSESSSGAAAGFENGVMRILRVRLDSSIDSPVYFPCLPAVRSHRVGWLIEFPRIGRRQHGLIRRQRNRKCRHFHCARYRASEKHSDPIERTTQNAAHPAFIAPDFINLSRDFHPSGREIDHASNEFSGDPIAKHLSLISLRLSTYRSTYRQARNKNHSHHKNLRTCQSQQLAPSAVPLQVEIAFVMVPHDGSNSCAPAHFCLHKRAPSPPLLPDIRSGPARVG